MLRQILGKNDQVAKHIASAIFSEERQLNT